MRADGPDPASCGRARWTPPAAAWPGTYGLKREKYDIAMAVGAPVFAGIRAGAAELSACDSETCRWWISDVTERPSVHPVELLRRSYRLPL